MNLSAQPKILDSVRISKPALQRILAAAQQRDVLNSQIVILNQRIDGMQLTINDLQERDTATVGSYERQIVTMKEQRVLLEAQVNTFEKMLRKEKRKRFFTGAAGMLTTGIGIYLAIKK